MSKLDNRMTMFKCQPDSVSHFCHMTAQIGLVEAIFIDFLGFRVYLGRNRTRHASRKLVFQCAPGGSFFAQFSFKSSAYVRAGA